MKKISLIVPVYNVEKYLRKCLESCLHQDISADSYEIIIVNDGSPDNSQEIIAEYASKHSNIKTILKENGGLSSARNAGLNIAEGELIWFIDSDDSIQENCLSSIISYFIETSAELITIDYAFFDENNQPLKKEKRHLVNGQIYNGLDLFQNGWIYPFSAVQFYIFKNDFIKQNLLSFKEGIYGEDWLYTLYSYTKLNKALYLDRPLYNYYIRKGSITHSKSSYKKGHDCIEICNELYKYRKETESDRVYIIDSAIAQTLKSVYIHWISNSATDAKKIRALALQKKFWINSIIKSRRYKYLIIYTLLKLNLRLDFKRTFHF